ncbi:polymeric immunoglobulin receptor-like [Astyanax mexicanus]|nr:polymeric immunoglobulin receptor-like [Astyanax mexicanus]
MKILLIFTFFLISDPCCLGPKTVIGYPGETTTISCPYPEEFQKNIKFFYKLQDKYVSAVITTRDTQKGRFSISDNRRSRVISVRISDVREDDVGVYYCGALIEGNKGSYLPLYTEIHLNTSTSSYPTSTNNYPTSTNNYPTSNNIYPTSTRSYPNSTNIYPTSTNIYPTSTSSYPTSTNIYPTTKRANYTNNNHFW